MRKVIFIILIVLLGIFIFKAYKSIAKQDMQCSVNHGTSVQPPIYLRTANDYLLLGDYDYDKGDCEGALVSYSRAIEINPKFAEAFNNRAYTNMRMQNYQEAISDLDKTLQLRPDYIQALMNRGDIYNYYYAIDRKKAISDYEKVIALGQDAIKGTSVCGHLFLARHNGWNLGTLLDFPQLMMGSCN